MSDPTALARKIAELILTRWTITGRTPNEEAIGVMAEDIDRAGVAELVAENDRLLTRMTRVLRLPETSAEVEATEPETNARRALELLCTVRSSEVVSVKIETLTELRDSLASVEAERDALAARLAAVERVAEDKEHRGVAVMGRDEWYVAAADVLRAARGETGEEPR